jgi:general secretion pathway protein G
MHALTWKRFSRDMLLTFATLLSLYVVPLGLVSFVAVFDRCSGDRNSDTARLDLMNLQMALRNFHEKHQRYPSTQEGLAMLVETQDLERFPRDPWGQPYQFRSREGVCWVWSHGADGLPGGTGVNADLLCQTSPRTRRCGWPRPFR